jgi:hypothetical protein
VRQYDSLAASLRGEKGGDGRGSSGLYSGRLSKAVEAREGVGEWGSWGGGVHPREVGGEVGDEPGKWVPPIRERERGEGLLGWSGVAGLVLSRVGPVAALFFFLF